MADSAEFLGDQVLCFDWPGGDTGHVEVQDLALPRAHGLCETVELGDARPSGVRVEGREALHWSGSPGPFANRTCDFHRIRLSTSPCRSAMEPRSSPPTAKGSPLPDIGSGSPALLDSRTVLRRRAQATRHSPGSAVATTPNWHDDASGAASARPAAR